MSSMSRATGDQRQSTTIQPLPHSLQNERGKRRPIKACLQCHRRKQKCDRREPCNMCKMRNVPHECVYGQTSLRRHQKEGQPGLNRQQDGVDPSLSGLNSCAPVVPSYAISDLTDSTGYAASAYAVEHDIASATPLDPDRAPAISDVQLNTEKLRPMYIDIRAQLPTKQVRHVLIEAFFKECNWFFGLLERYHFDEWKAEWEALDQEPVNSAWLVMRCWRFTGILFQLLAVALQFLHPQSEHAKLLDIANDAARIALSQRFSENGLKISDLVGRYDADLVSVNHGLLRSFWLKNAGRGKEAWFAMGGCIKLALELGLHRIDDDWAGTAARRRHECMWDLEYKRRLWAKLFSWDSHMSLSLGRPRTIRLEECNVNDPIDCDYPSDKMQEYPPDMSTSGLPSSFTAHWFQYQVSQIMHEVLSSGVHKAGGQNHITVLETHRKIGNMVQNLPLSTSDTSQRSSFDSSTPNVPVMRLQVEVTANAFLLALQRRHSRNHLLNRSFAIEAALKVLAAQEQLFRVMKKVPHTIFMLSYYSVDAGLYLAAVLAGHAHNDPHVVEQIRQALRLTTGRLSWMADRSRVAASGLLAITKISRAHSQLSMRETARSHGGTVANLGGSDQTTLTGEIAPTSLPESGFGSIDNGVMEDLEDWRVLSGHHGPATEDTVQDQQLPDPILAHTFDPFMGVTGADYTVENFLSELL